MQKLTVQELLEATGGKLIKGEAETEITSVTQDSRMVKSGTLFIPLIGENNDGHIYIEKAIENGASAFLTASEDVPEGAAAILVRDTLKAMGDIAAFYKEKYRIPTVAITGSVGKTTTKDLMYAALSVKYKTVKTPNNFNNDIGVPLTVFMQEKEHEAAVIEMGMNHFGEIDRLCEIAKPDAAVITNIGMSHIENLGSRDGIFKAKMEIAKRFGKNNTLIVNGDDEYLSKLKDDPNIEYKVLSYGIENPKNDVYAKNVKSKGLLGIEFSAVVDGKEYPVTVTQPGEHNVYNALAAICTALVFGINVREAVKGIAKCEYTAQRLEVIEHKGIEIINDCYNASPDSMRAALSIIPYTLKKRKTAVLGDMLEMGMYASEAHYDIGEFAANKLDLLITAGKEAKEIARGARAMGMKEVYDFDTTDEALSFAKKTLKKDDCVLIKASHGMHFEKIVKAIREI